jgi:hypothetical protein
MENLGTMDPEEILQLLSGSIACGFVIFVFIIVYVVISRRGKRTAKGTGLGMPSIRQETSIVTQPPPEDDRSSIDVSARLVGTGREAWLEEASSSSAETSESGDHSPVHGQEILRLLRDPLNGQIWVQVAGMRYRSLNDIRDRAVGERVLASVTHLLRFSKGMAATEQGVVTLELPPSDAVRVPTAFGVLSDTHESDELIRLMSDPDQDRFCVHVFEQCYRRLVDVSEQKTGQYILEAITRLLQFSNGMLATNDGVGVVPVPPLSLDVHTPLPESATAASQISESIDAPASAMTDPALRSTQASYALPDSAEPLNEQEQFLHQLRSQPPLPQTETPIERPSLISSLRRVRQEAPSADALPSLNLADEIDRIFQQKLVASGNTSVDAKVETRPDGGVRIRIGMVYYDSPDDVPDSYLREMLKLSIAEWEQG